MLPKSVTSVSDAADAVVAEVPVNTSAAISGEIQVKRFDVSVRDPCQDAGHTTAGTSMGRSQP
ncbi:hypothetical protein [Streptomyces turgidiscabies]|uniref:Uncharacterized protein n=1 Tax=Streptomyces turgidiscabies TaxID=85558 RepID=A0ABU0RIV8_9ACTN|nr:hypothetical protein [Streptomyces turgidiscabies]MDQ0931932.1 hypothetical protein [Streptomyces turgidiscabies]